MRLKSPKAKGSAGEREAVKAIEDIGLRARKQPLSGALQSFPYDLHVWQGEKTYTCEVKRYKRGAAVDKLRNGADLLLYRADHGEWCCWLPLSVLGSLLND